jgi:hypothetical protein
MGWETRRGRSYYYRKTRVGSRVVTRYVGGGTVGAMLAAFDKEERQREQLIRRAEAEKLRREVEFDGALDALSQATEAAAEALLLASGFHKHKGQWRRTRDGKTGARREG